jgi:hypothetical protein
LIFFSRLSKNFIPKKKEDDEYQFTATKAFKLMLNEINDLAGELPYLQAATSFADPDWGSGAFLTPGYGIRGEFFPIMNPS